MRTIALRTYGRVLSGRSLAREVIQKEQLRGPLDNEVHFDFQDVDACSMSFLHEVIKELKAMTPRPSKIIFSGHLNDQVEKTWRELINAYADETL